MKNVVCFGEVLWDNFKDGKKPGGAPMNVALHLFKNAVNPGLISSIGKDEYGEELLNYLETEGISTVHVQQHKTLPTGIVEVNLDENRQATYTIVKPVAWDEIEINKDLEELVKNSDAFLFGSLACRSKTSRSTLFKLLSFATFKVLDLNLRYPHYTDSLIKDLLTKCDLLKLNEDELQVIKKLFALPEEKPEELISSLAGKINIKTICVTLGEEGAIIWHKENIYRHKGYKVTVADTVGAGDAFLATLLSGILKNHPINITLEKACAAGALVASKPGANPDYSMEDITQLIHKAATT